jgi:hypothetical protein
MREQQSVVKGDVGSTWEYMAAEVVTNSTPCCTEASDVRTDRGFRLAHDAGAVESWGAMFGLENPPTICVTTPKDDYDHYVGFRLIRDIDEE